MADLPIGPQPGGGPFTVGSGTGLQTGGVYTEDSSAASIARFGQATYIYWGQNTVTAGTPGPAGTAASTGVNPVETSYSLYGHTVPLSVLGLARIGGEIISGPWLDPDAGIASFCISFGVPADASGTRTLKEIAFDSEVVWTVANGYSNENHFTFRWYDGNLTQAADPIEIAHSGADAVAYRPQMLLWFENLPLDKTKFKKIPYVAALISDSSGEDVNLGEAFERLAYSPYVGFTPDQFVTEDITDSLIGGGMILVEQADFLSTIQQFGRFYRNWDIIQTDKLKIVDHGSKVTADLVVNKTHLTNNIPYTWAEANSTARTLELSTIDPGADYTIVPSTAGRPLVPVAVSASVRSEAAYLPVVMDAHTRQALVAYTKYQEEIARKKISGTLMMYGLELEPGDMIGMSGLGPDFQNEVFKITETTHGVNYTVEFRAESLFNCGFGGDPYWIYVVLLMGYEGNVTDQSPKLHGNAAYQAGSSLDPTQSKFGSSSLLPPLLYSDNADWWLSHSNSDQFTVECWAKLAHTPTGVEVFVGSSFSDIAWFFGLQFGELRFSWTPPSTGSLALIVSSGALLAPGVWYHLAVDKDATGKIRLYRNGTMVGSATPSDSAMEDISFHELDIGQIGLFGTNDFIGNLDELRITKGIARYHTDGSFAVPASAFPRGGV